MNSDCNRRAILSHVFAKVSRIRRSCAQSRPELCEEKARAIFRCACQARAQFDTRPTATVRFGRARRRGNQSMRISSSKIIHARVRPAFSLSLGVVFLELYRRIIKG